MSALLQSPHTDVESDGAASDHTLVAAVRRGDERAFEALYQRYQRRIHAYVVGMVKDHQRAEDVTQEVFVSALRRMRATERPIAFKPWIYEIAKNACIDQFRRSKRAEEVSFDADDGLAPSDYGRLVSTEPVPDAALVAKQQLDHLCGAFGGLSDAHHQILVMRELEGLSYREIGEKMGMTRPAVESTLFRARRRLGEEYDELASGQRCLRIQSIIANAGSGKLGARDTRRLARHVAHCQPCRREAVAANVDSALLARRSARQRAADKVAALFPMPFFLRGRRGGSSSSESWLAQLPQISEHASAGTAKLAAAAALLVAALGAGVGPDNAPAGEGQRPGAITIEAVERHAAPAPVTAPKGASIAPVRGSDAPKKSRTEGRDGRLRATGGKKTAGRTLRAPATTKSRPSGDGPSSGGGGAAVGGGGGGGGGGGQGGAPHSGPAQGGNTQSAPSSGAGGTGIALPDVDLPVAPERATTAPIETVVETVESVPSVTQDVTQGVTGAVDQATSGATAPVSNALNGLTSP
jgi:RNA polymerase sigma factor (sigma-70 family)